MNPASWFTTWLIPDSTWTTVVPLPEWQRLRQWRLLEPFLYNDLGTNTVPVNYNGTNFGNNGSLGVWLLHMHNGDNNRSDVIAFRAPTITSVSPTHAKVGAFVTLTGSNYGPGTQVFFQGPSFSSVQATPVNVLTANTIS